uniref:NADH-ubiquinone oxidoreductase chain 3 n=1 Tax=Unio tumidus TaxID=143298 RepID=A0A1Q1MMP3_9BIVA|nr:NADH dehydrogenase subunit 3 [Unio tumidus]AQM37812.1 NADH dehydrogenase subunit 3 [Unio tumidus]AQM37826.1 NADH dehydrogenase subunit 3 [Unio tumidus]
MILVSVICSSIIGLVVFWLGLMISFRSIDVKGLSSPFECGFDPMGSSRIGFSLRFFLIMILFVIFDFETVLLIPSVMWLSEGLMSNWSVFCFVSFLTMLLVGALFELWKGALQWKD